MDDAGYAKAHSYIHTPAKIMTYFPDLSPFSYGRKSETGVVHVGWLDDEHSFPTGNMPTHLIEKLRSLAKIPTELRRGYHICELCKMPDDVKKAYDDKLALLNASHLPENKNKPLKQFMVNNLYDSWRESRQSNGEIRVHAASITYAAPVLIVHYIDEHKYMPPAEFLRALEEMVELNVSTKPLT